MIVIIKNRREKGGRVFLKGENPHSNGDNLIWLKKDFFPARIAKVAKATAIIIISVDSKNIFVIKILTSRWR
jgi:hypothetical protein